jgi:uncharacterized protein
MRTQSTAGVSLFAPDPDLPELNRHYAGPCFYLKSCAFGVGVFARHAIGKGELILPITGRLIDFAETKRRGPRECMAIQIGANVYVDTRPPAVFVNHSCEPNAGIKRDRFLVALRPIRADEEICYDYSTTMEEGSFTMPCACGSPSCREVVRDFSTLPAARRARYIAQRVVMGFILSRTAAPSAPASSSGALECTG